MHCETPVLKKCCFCFPLRPGLIVCGYLKLILALTLAVIPSITVVVLYYESEDHDADNINIGVDDLIIAILLLFLTLFDIAMTILFLISAHSKNWKLFRIYYRHVIIFSTMTMVVFLVYAAVKAHGMSSYDKSFSLWEFVMWTIIVLFINIIVLVYIVLLLRSELIKLQNESCESVNKTLEAQFLSNVNDLQFIDSQDIETIGLNREKEAGTDNKRWKLEQQPTTPK